MASWQPDVLGEGFEQLTLELGSDAQGEIVATLVRALPAPVDPPSWWDRVRRRIPAPPPWGEVDVLYVHGWSDYFFQRRLARTFTERGARFFALDLRRYGRSLRPGQIPGYIDDLADYDAEIGAALEEMGTGGGRRLLLLGHSTGGLTLSLWAHRHPGVAAGLLLNSPWLEFQLPRQTRETLAPLVHLSARLHPFDRAPQMDFGYYTRAQAEVADPADPVSVDLRWRPEQTMAVHAGWLKAVLDGHAAVAAGLRIGVPVGVLLSARSAVPARWSEELTRADSVLVVDDIARAALNLGPVVTVIRIDGALHDVFLSRHEAREEAYRRTAAWVQGWIASLTA